MAGASLTSADHVNLYIKAAYDAPDPVTHAGLTAGAMILKADANLIGNVDPGFTPPAITPGTTTTRVLGSTVPLTGTGESTVTNFTATVYLNFKDNTEHVTLAGLSAGDEVGVMLLAVTGSDETAYFFEGKFQSIAYSQGEFFQGLITIAPTTAMVPYQKA